MQKNRIQKSIIKTLCYSDVFDYPLRKRELWKFLNIRGGIYKKNFENTLNQMVIRFMVGEKNGFYFLNGRNKIVKIRLARSKISIVKLKIAKKAAKLLFFIPTIKLIGISGSLSLKNAKLADDIDFFIITKSDCLWITRFLVNVLLLLARFKRSAKDSRGTNLICPNLFMSEDKLLLPAERQNLFSAREISQVLVLLDRENMYQRFLSANKWINKLLMNVQISAKMNKFTIGTNKITNFVDGVFYAFQFLYMSNKITGEEVKRKVAYFHPQDKAKIILKIYKLRYEKYTKDILQDIDNNFPILYI